MQASDSPTYPKRRDSWTEKANGQAIVMPKSEEHVHTP